MGKTIVAGVATLFLSLVAIALPAQAASAPAMETPIESVVNFEEASLSSYAG